MRYICSKCYNAFDDDEGYYDGEDYYCDEECLNKDYETIEEPIPIESQNEKNAYEPTSFFRRKGKTKNIVNR